MKKYNALLIIILALLLSLTGCSSETGKTEVPEDAAEQQSNNNDNEDSNAAEESAEENPIKPAEENNNEEEVVALNNAEAESQTVQENVQANVNANFNENIPAENPSQETNIADSSKNSDTDSDLAVLKIEGLENELSFTLDELKAMEDFIFEADFYSLNSFGTTGYTHFKGVNLWNLLEYKALISDKAAKISVIAQDGYKMEFTVDQVKKQDYMDETNPDNKYPMIIAWEENGEEYDAEEGAPFKLVVGQKEAGDVNKPQWVSNIDKIVIE